MSKGQAVKFILFAQRDEKLKRKYEGIVNKYEGKSLTEEEQEKIVREEVLPLAKNLGFDFSPGDFQEMLQPVKKVLNDEELDEAVGGRGQFHHYTLLFTCELAPDDETLFRHFHSPANFCPGFDYAPEANSRSCLSCKHLKVIHKNR